MKSQIFFILLIALLGFTNGQYFNRRSINQINSYLEKQTQIVNKLVNALHTDLTKMPSKLEDASLIRDVAYQLFNMRATLTSFYTMMVSVLSSFDPLYILTTLTREIQNTVFAILSDAFKLTARLANSGKKIEDAFPETLKGLNNYELQILLSQLNPANLYYSMTSLLKDTINNLKIGSILSDLLRENDLGKLLNEISDLIDKLSRYNY